MKVKFFATYREIAGTAQVQWPEEKDVLSLLVGLSARFGPKLQEKLLNQQMDDIHGDTIILVNGRHVAHLQGARTPLCDEDVVAIFPVIAGG